MRKVTMLDESQPGKAIAGKATATSTTGRRTWPTPIWVPKLVRNGVATASEQKTTIFVFLNKQDNTQGPTIFSGTLKVVSWT
jgi:hypothetical protein